MGRGGLSQLSLLYFAAAADALPSSLQMGFMEFSHFIIGEKTREADCIKSRRRKETQVNLFPSIFCLPTESHETDPTKSASSSSSVYSVVPPPLLLFPFSLSRQLKTSFSSFVLNEGEKKRTKVTPPPFLFYFLSIPSPSLRRGCYAKTRILCSTFYSLHFYSFS